MSKFYATSGSRSLVVTAFSAESAAIRLINEVMATHSWIYDDEGLTDQVRYEHVALEALLNLESSVSVSQIGSGRSEAGEFGVPELLQMWHQLMTGLTKFLDASESESKWGQRSK